MANTSLNRSIKMTPKAALSLDKAGRAKLRANVLGSQKQGNRAAKPPHKIHTAVRIKINKSVLGKSTTPSWSSKIYKIEQIYPGRGPMEQPRYRINKKGADECCVNPSSDQPAIVVNRPLTGTYRVELMSGTSGHLVAGKAADGSLQPWVMLLEFTRRD